MPPRRKFNKDNSTTFNVVHRAQNDPLIHDSDANQFVLAEKAAPRRANGDEYDNVYASGSQYSGASYRSYKVKQREDLESEFGGSVRENEGEAAQHGVFYDDTSYDYMQHMKDLGTGEGASTFVPANTPSNKDRKGKQSLVDALRNSTYNDDMRSVGQSSTTESIARSLFPEEVLPSEFVTKRSYQDQQDIPDEIAGFQPDMDPRLREVLEALEDEEYVDDEEDIFAELTKEGYEVDRDEWDLYGEQHTFEDEEEDAGWESDDTIRAATPTSSSPPPDLSALNLTDAPPPSDPLAVPPADPTHGAWLEEFEKFKAADKKSSSQPKLLANGRPAPSALESSILSSLASGRRKKRKGAQTSTTNYSMTSSALARTAPLTLLDDRFDKIENAYSLAEFPEEEEDAYNDSQSLASGMTGASRVSKAYSTQSGLSGVSGVSSYSRAEDDEAPNLVRSDFDGIMDDFLGSHNKAGKFGKRIRKGKTLTGMQQLDEIRGQLGPARREGRVVHGEAR
ncbi:related to low-temperature viability protein LTV1 [Ramularia collo-cygni]|uniref:Related to low-temperature viability protein LTV1 n=1 Tax=Ramularia collo-cygni TaxID=112498 RepID=A0A2D3V9Z1_9PEZI|nr:related to low-temperature viability protein LTV1 [Ramularia collo-cygni]CZT21587.1 related to low-temperature viability protein LTV1 [Ramularia collo-cygni]